ncbi:unnamed protein product [Adineta ricciae]|uniref:Uncharacterized protein n=1 Tax=Adineta ricciae TaxID=249248 RepID=A0A813NVX1_ADIRI|nr:unnamed protein product [Adineta ricciae]
MLSIHSGLLASTLECYYNASCLQLFVPNSFIFQPSKTTLPSRFTPQGTIANVANQSLTEILSYNFSHAEYYMQCAPRWSEQSTSPFYSNFCQTVNEILEQISLETLYRIDRNNIRNSLIIIWCFYTSLAKETYWKKTLLIDLFSSNSNDALLVDRERKMTRLYTLLLVVTTVFLAFYINLFSTEKTNAVNNPSQDKYQDLCYKYSDILNCPCSSSARITCSDIMKLVQAYVRDSDNFYQADVFPVNTLTPEDRFNNRANRETITKYVFFSTYMSHALQDVLQLSSTSYAVPRLYTYFDMKIASDGSIRTGPLDSSIVHVLQISTHAQLMLLG